MLYNIIKAPSWIRVRGAKNNNNNMVMMSNDSILELYVAAFIMSLHK